MDLPDGRTQIVTYNVGDANSGFVADVKYVPTNVPVRPFYGPPAPVVPHPAPLLAPVRPVPVGPHPLAAPVHLGK